MAPDTIAAIATPPGVGGVGIVRISGPAARQLAAAMLGRVPKPRRATFRPFLDEQGRTLDQGLALFFPGPHSFTGEDILELQGHGGPVVLDQVLRRALQLGARLARPGEFSERAFLNGKLDLAQAEAIADLIESATAQAAQLAARTLQGDFSRRVRTLVEQLIELRAFVEASVDFPEEDLDFFVDGRVQERLLNIQGTLEGVRRGARQGQLLRDGLTLVIAGLPNAGKSSLLNALSGQDTAIVTSIPGTTRDLLRERIQLDGLPLHLIDTAGLRQVSDALEQEGIRRARQQIHQADRILWVFDDSQAPEHDAPDRASLPGSVPVTLVRNKIDLTGRPPGLRETALGWEVALAAGTGLGLDLLREHLKTCAGYQGPMEGELMARRRHLDALARAAGHIQAGCHILEEDRAAELLAEELLAAQRALSEITGEFLPDDLLGEIFGRFCIGK